MLSLHHFFATVGLYLASTSASPTLQNSTSVQGGGVVVTVTSTLTATVLASSSVSASSSTVSSQPVTQPTSWLAITAVRSGSSIHLLPMNAAGQRFYLGGTTISYCPEQVAAEQACPPGNTTVVSLCSMGALVPGGQQIYVTLGGEIGYSQAHSAYIPPGSIPCPFTYSKAPGAFLGRLGMGSWYNATGLMACPTSGKLYQVMANVKNATVPMGNVSQCLGFEALAADVPDLGAWQYT